jgi:hypothetical protein
MLCRKEGGRAVKEEWIDDFKESTKSCVLCPVGTQCLVLFPAWLEKRRVGLSYTSTLLFLTFDLNRSQTATAIAPAAAAAAPLDTISSGDLSQAAGGGVWQEQGVCVGGF